MVIACQSNTRGYQLFYHYWFATSPKKTDPVALWLQGGPGATAIGYGLLTEMGPYYTDETSMQNKTTPGVPDLFDNPYSWSSVANMLFLEAPPSVGFSYCGPDPKTTNCGWNDTSQAQGNHLALQAFFKAYPEFAENEFFVTGESYGGTCIFVE